MKYARADAAAAVCNRKIIVCGGWGDDGYLKSMECFDPEAGIWTELVDMPSPRTDHFLVFYGNTLIIMGGINGEAGAIPVVELDPLEENGQWKELPPTKIRGSLVGIVLGREIFAIDTNSDPGPVHVEIFDGSSWRYGPVLPVEFVLPSVVLIPQNLVDQFRNLKMQ